MAAANRAELEALEASLQQFRVNELHILLSSFKCPKLGKKTELVQRCINLLQNARNQAAVIQKIREISSSRRYSTSSAPSVPMYNHVDGNSVMNGYNPVITLSSALMQQQYISAHNPFSSQMTQTRTLNIADLPFYDKQQTLLELSELPANISGIRSTSRLAFTFAIPSNIMPHIAYRNESAALPRTELQLRFFLLDHSVEQHDDFPPNCSVKIDDVPVTLPNIIPTNKPNAEPKRPSRPVNITPYCQPPRDALRPHRLVVEWSADKRSWAIGIYVVKRLTSDILLQRLLANLDTRRDAEETKRMIRNRLSSDDDAIQMETLRISLLCPLGKTRMIIPVKAFDCTHLQCFDLSNFLKMNEKRPTWKCAVCNNGASYKKLIIDGYFERVLKDTTANITEVELLREGGWRPFDEEEKSVSDNEEISSSNDSKSHSKSVKNSVLHNGNRLDGVTDDDVIILDSDDDDEVLQQLPSQNSMNRVQRRDVTPSVVCIDLDDSDPVDLSPQTYQASRVSSTPLSFNNTASTSSASATSTAAAAGGSAQMSATRPIMHYTQQQQSPHPSQSMPYFPNPAVSMVPPPDAVIGGANNASYFHSFEQPYPYYQQDFNTRLIAEELRQFMANIQQSTNPPNFPKYSS
ncbi:MIZ zinc finger family protein [Loa loa]|uniref:MIZ zinc finger family protein n=1 Tax=Loa loa TaxID=7209 RepID=A0A1I7VYB8_LOALO|nr:MIZ zinc finger family protein [Loa loa]EFO22955.2 MIZ zinc finger family protein [Loa loa]